MKPRWLLWRRFFSQSLTLGGQPGYTGGVETPSEKSPE